MGKLETYRRAQMPKTKKQYVWPLYGAGMENFGFKGHMIEKLMPSLGDDELLVRHDACGLCFSDIKIIKLGENHPRIHRNMRENPVVMGHEVSFTIVGVGKNLTSQYKPGDRFTLQADIFVDGIGYAYGYEIQGGLSQYNIIDQRILNGDHGNYLIPVKPDTGYAESALVEPWACVIAAYHLNYRTSIKPEGKCWFIGPESSEPFSVSTGIQPDSHPEEIRLTNMNGELGNFLRQQAKELGIKLTEIEKIPDSLDENENNNLFDDIILLSPSANIIETVSPFLNYQGVLALFGKSKIDRKVQVDVGRIHYNRWAYIGGLDHDIARLYQHNPIRSALKPNGKALFVGAGGPMGRMHVQHAIESDPGPEIIVCSDVSDERLADLKSSFIDEAEAKGRKLICINPNTTEDYQQTLESYGAGGFDDIVMLAPIPAIISESAALLAQQGVMNIFAGVARGTFAELDLNEITQRDVRIIGHSASSIDDMIMMLNEVENKRLSTNRSVAAIGSLSAAKDGMQALIDAVYPGKVVIFPHLKDLPLTSLKELQHRLPSVYAKLGKQGEWTRAAENELLNLMLNEAGE